jgi:hypothetical protein
VYFFIASLVLILAQEEQEEKESNTDEGGKRKERVQVKCKVLSCRKASCFGSRECVFLARAYRLLFMLGPSISHIHLYCVVRAIVFARNFCLEAH